MPDSDFDEKFATFLEGCMKIVAEDHKRFANLRNPWLEVVTRKPNTRYIAIRCYDDWNKEAVVFSGRPEEEGIRFRAYAFVDSTNGDVLKPATWKKPAKHARGNIFNSDNGLGQMGPYGPAYLT